MKKQNKKTFSPNNPPRSRGRPPEHPTQELETTRVPSPNSLPRAGDQIPLSAGSRKTTRRSTTLPCRRDHPKNTPIEPKGHHDPCPIQYHAAGSRKLLSAGWPTDSGSTRCQNDDGAPQHRATTTRIEPYWHQAIGSIYFSYPTTPETHKSLGVRPCAAPGGHNSEARYMRYFFELTPYARALTPRAHDSRTPETPYVSEVAMRRLRQCHNTRPCRHAFLRESTTTPGWGHTHAGVQTLPEVNHGPGIEFRCFQRSCRPRRESHHDGAPQRRPTNVTTSGGTLCIPHPFVCSWPMPQCRADARNIDLALMRHTRQPDAMPPWHRNRTPLQRARGTPCPPHPFVRRGPAPQSRAQARDIHSAPLRQKQQSDATPPRHRDREPRRRAGRPPGHPASLSAGNKVPMLR